MTEDAPTMPWSPGGGRIGGRREHVGLPSEWFSEFGGARHRAASRPGDCWTSPNGGTHMNVLPTAERERITALAYQGASLRAISEQTGHSTNTIRGYLTTAIAPPDRVRVKATGLYERCERCGYSPSSHTPSSKARQAGNTAVCERAVVTCRGCGGWAAAYTTSRWCNACRMAAAQRRREQWQASEPQRTAMREQRRQRRLLAEGRRTLTAIRGRLHGRSPSRRGA